MVTFLQSLPGHCLRMARNNAAKKKWSHTGDPSGTFRHKGDQKFTAYWVLYVSVSTCDSRSTSEIMCVQYVRGTSLSRQVCLISVALHATGCAAKMSYSYKVMSVLKEPNPASHRAARLEPPHSGATLSPCWRYNWCCHIFKYFAYV